MPSPSYHPAATAKAPSIHQTAPTTSPTDALTPAHAYYRYIRACARVSRPRSIKRYTRVHQRANHHAKPEPTNAHLIKSSPTQASIQQVKREDTRREGRKCSRLCRVQNPVKQCFLLFHEIAPPKSEFSALKYASFKQPTAESMRKSDIRLHFC